MLSRCPGMSGKKLNPRKGRKVSDQTLADKLNDDAAQREHERKQGLEDDFNFVIRKFIRWGPAALVCGFVAYVIYLVAVGRVNEVQSLVGSTGNWLFGVFSTVAYQKLGFKKKDD